MLTSLDEDASSRLQRLGPLKCSAYHSSLSLRYFGIGPFQADDVVVFRLINFFR